MNNLLFTLLFTPLFTILTSTNAIGAEQELLPTKSGLYDVGGFKLYLECYENDKPLLILEQGFGRSGSEKHHLHITDRDLVVKSIKELVEN